MYRIFAVEMNKAEEHNNINNELLVLGKVKTTYNQ